MSSVPSSSTFNLPSPASSTANAEDARSLAIVLVYREKALRPVMLIELGARKVLVDLPLVM